MIRAFLIAVQFLTFWPVPLKTAPNEREIGLSLALYPLVGLLLGSVLSGVAWLLGTSPHILSAALLLSAWTIATGGLHLDGLADCADAWVGGAGDRERTLAIMKDPNSGPMGITAIVLVLIVKFGALATLCDQQAIGPLLLAPLLGRAVLTLLFLTTPYVRPGGLGAPLAAHLRRAEVVFALLVTGVGVLLIDGALLALFVVLATFALLRHAMLIRIGGITGDTAGALAELSECAVLVIMALAE